MKKIFVCLLVITVFISLFASSAIFAQSPVWSPEPATMEYLKWFMQTQGHPHFSIGENGWFESSPSGFGNNNFNAAGIVTGAPVPAWTPEPGTRAYVEWFLTQGHPDFSSFLDSGVNSNVGGSSSGGDGWFEGSPSGFGSDGF
jgi:hypothetical protein